MLPVTACTVTPSPSPSGAAPISFAPSADASAAPSRGGALIPGRPYAAADILEAMRTSPRPDGVPDELQTDAIAAAIASAIWTADGTPWDTLVVDASCGDRSCAVDVAGSRSGVDGEDLWTFAVMPSSGSVSVERTALRAVPPDLVTELEDLARSLVDPADLEGMTLSAVLWEPPPTTDRYTLTYRSGGEEGSCGLELVVDPRAGEVVDRRSVGAC